MARGRHARPSGWLSLLLAWLLPRPIARRRAAAERERALLRELHEEVQRLRGLGEQHVAEAALAGVRAQRAEEQALAAWKEAHALRTEVVRLREHLREAREQGQPADVASAQVIDLRPVASG